VRVRALSDRACEGGVAFRDATSGGFAAGPSLLGRQTVTGRRLHVAIDREECAVRLAAVALCHH